MSGKRHRSCSSIGQALLVAVLVGATHVVAAVAAPADSLSGAALRAPGRSHEKPGPANPSGVSRQSDVAAGCAVEWLIGSWSGDGFGGRVVETWTPTGQGTLIGTFALSKAAEIEFLELMTIGSAEGVRVLSLRHFDQNLVSWEENNSAYSWPEVSCGEGWMDFGAVRYEVSADGSLRVLVRSTNGQPEALTLTRESLPR